MSLAESGTMAIDSAQTFNRPGTALVLLAATSVTMKFVTPAREKAGVDLVILLVSPPVWPDAVDTG